MMTGLLWSFWYCWGPRQLSIPRQLPGLSQIEKTTTKPTTTSRLQRDDVSVMVRTVRMEEEERLMERENREQQTGKSMEVSEGMYKKRLYQAGAEQESQTGVDRPPQ